jgi:hypothetical protein
MNPIALDRLATPTAPPAASVAGAVHDTALADPSPAFRTLLDSLQRLVDKQPKAPEVACPDTLREALRDTDQVFAQAMDLRKRLEDAFRARLP